MKAVIYEKGIAWNNIKGNGLLKRAIEIALSGQHTITIIGNPDNGKEYLNAMKSQIIVKLERPLFNEIVSVLTGEPFTDVMYRIDTFNKLKTVKSTDQDAMEFLKTAYNKLLFTSSQINRVLAVSKTIAIMDNSDIVHSQHMAEAIQYQALDY